MNKDRDSFFGQYGSYGYNAGPYMYPNMTNQNGGYSTDVNDRLNKIEREISNINNRLAKLEAGNNITTTNNDFNFTNSMYMV